MAKKRFNWLQVALLKIVITIDRLNSMMSLALVRLMKELQVPRKKKRHKGWPKGKVFGVLFCIVAILLVAYGAWQYSQQSSHTNEGLLTDIDGNKFSLEDFRGKVVILDLFATWCQPCLQQIPQLAEIYGKYDHDEVIIISISSPSDNEEHLRQFRDEHQMSWRVARDTAGVFDKYNVVYIPTIAILDQNGAVYYINEGLTDASTLSSKIDFLLG